MPSNDDYQEFEKETRNQIIKQKKRQPYDRFKNEYEWLLDQNRRHSGEWLTRDIAVFYRDQATALGGDGSDVGERRRLRMELQKRCGILPIEAINILNGYWIDIYVAKYERIRTMTSRFVGEDLHMYREWVEKHIHS